MKGTKGFSFVEGVAIFAIAFILVTVICSKIIKIDQGTMEERKEAAENSEIIKEDEKIEKYMVIVCRDSGPYDTLYTEHKGVIEEVGDLVIYKSENLRIISKSTILEIPIRNKYSDMDEFSSGIDLDDY